MVNPILKGVQITQPPDWLSPEEKLTGKRATAISFAFTDESNKILKGLLDQPFYMFGEPVRVEMWKERPKQPQCKRCWKLTHYTKQCTARVQRCRLCGKAGSEENHQEHCDECQQMPAGERQQCTHFSCPNCRGNDHGADFPRCPSILGMNEKNKPGPRRSKPHSQPTQTTPSS